MTPAHHELDKIDLEAEHFDWMFAWIVFAGAVTFTMGFAFGVYVG